MSAWCFMGLNGWETGALTITIGVTAEVWEYDVELGASVATPYEVAESVVSWANDGARTWAGPPVFSWAAVASETWRLGITITCDQSVTLWSATLPLRERLFWPASGSGLTMSSSAAVLGSLGQVATQSVYGMRNWQRQPRESGNVSDGGGWAGEVGAWAPQRPVVSGVLDEGARYAETLAVREAGNPRIADIYDVDTWRAVVVGQIEANRVTPTHYSTTWQVASR